MTTPQAREPEGPAAVAARIFDVRGRRALVTGAASGLGRAMAEVLAGAGARVTLADKDPAGLEKVAADLAALGGQVRQARMNVSDPGEVQGAVTDAVDA